jgi:hypothetical protein
VRSISSTFFFLTDSSPPSAGFIYALLEPPLRSPAFPSNFLALAVPLMPKHRGERVHLTSTTSSPSLNRSLSISRISCPIRPNLLSYILLDVVLRLAPKNLVHGPSSHVWHISSPPSPRSCARPPPILVPFRPNFTPVFAIA